MPKQKMTEVTTKVNTVNSPQKQIGISCPRFSQKIKRTENKKQRLAEALRENLRKRKEQTRARKKP